MKEFSPLKAKTCSYLTDSSNKDKKSQIHKKVCRKMKLQFEDYKHCLGATQLENKINHSEKTNFYVENL